MGIPPLPGTGRGKEIMVPVSASGGVLGSPMRLEIEEYLGPRRLRLGRGVNISIGG
jgi:hypothetical protein